MNKNFWANNHRLITKSNDSFSVITFLFTVFGGILVFIVSQIILKFIIGPIQDQRETIGKIADALIFYANIYTSSGSHKVKINNQAATKLRQLSTQLQSKTYLIPFYKIFGFFHFVPSKTNINIASQNLIGLSNSCLGVKISFEETEYILEYAKRIRTSLGIYDPNDL